MYFNQVYYNLTCTKCSTHRPDGTMTVHSNEDISHFKNDALIKHMDNFKQVQCENCNKTGQWEIHSVGFKNKDPKLKDFKLTILKNESGIKSTVEKHDFFQGQLDEIYINIRARIEELKGQYLPIKENGSASFLVNTFDVSPYIRIVNYQIEGISVDELIEVIDSLTGKKTHKGISGELNKKLENAFDDLKENQEDPLVITHLQSKDKLTNFYIIAKLPDADIYYGIMETEFSEYKMIEGIPLVNFEPYDLIEVPMTPFRTKEYIVNDVKSNS